MKTFKANNYDQAVKEIDALDKSKTEVIKEDIRFEDRKHFHVAMVRITDRPGEAKNDVSVNVQMFHDQGFVKLQKSFSFLGWNKLVVVHDPRQNEIEATNPTIEKDSAMKTPAEIEAEIEAKAEKMFQEKLAKMEAGKKTSDSTKSGDVPEVGKDSQMEFFASSTVDQLKEYAKTNEIDLSGLKAKEDIKLAIVTWYEDQQNETK
jgi:hypothetical protein